MDLWFLEWDIWSTSSNWTLNITGYEETCSTKGTTLLSITWANGFEPNGSQVPSFLLELYLVPSQTILHTAVTLTFRKHNLEWQYYEMLYNTADELLNLVVDQGVKYTELEYIHALTLLHRSQTGVGDQTTQNMRLQRLKEIICEQAAIKQATKDKKITTV
ncbi:hypothetical protein J1605_009571 [Eschrichtius robustus]|uniref:Exocyst complex component Sec8 n=1 Tax=Eschrichtius robustus TaxID=9764 RepID=A0AB34GUH0_ESCRO|nr:hypothetical protein J1605_009571 [Eschrichtius robustus]